MYRRLSRLIAALLTCALLSPTTACQAQNSLDPLSSITEAELRDHIHYLASDFLAGRKTGETGYTLAAQYGAILFDAAGLQPLFTDSTGAPSFFQPVAFESVKVSGESSMQVEVDGEVRRYGLREEFLAAQIFSGGELEIDETPLFLGYGLEEPEHGWNDYEGLNVSGKIAVIVSGAPTRNGEPVLPPDQHRVHSNFSRSVNARIISAREHDVAALIIVIDAASTSLWREVDAWLDRSALRPKAAGLGEESDSRSASWIVLVRAEEAADFLSGVGYDPVARKGPCVPGPLDGVRIALDLKQDVEPAFAAPNVVALLPGTEPILKDEYIVVTAHLDHVGVRSGQVYNGADDNASGSAAVLEAAEAAGMAPTKRSLIFVLFAAEEEGLLGSQFFADNPPVPLENMVLNINLDMVGRNSSDWPESLLALGSEDRRPELLQLIRNVNARAGANLDWRLNEGSDPYAHVQRSDLAAFIQKGIPSILITRGFMGPDYHRPSDDPETINYAKVTQAARLAYALAAEAGNREVLFEKD